ncbi:MAG: hypothetical protein EF807_07140 [Candidatus Methanolliviera hydrocarbonicum]|uniref:AbrB/MazE/SpoVT family DNA-binding domain-containing protein n=1 Tax=Candidatus Methanolliviera hydrocarbonicum TaxID=2491085 RepID=A0A520KV72_9EURY|nr:MAG: hypothetical protein EF807_07140 [Candidatus Methanolliviera hydrocarbonicum]
MATNESRIDLGLAGMIKEVRDEISGTVIDFVRGNSLFKVRVGKQNRITIPDPEAEAMGIEEGDLIQVMIIPLKSFSSREAKREDI